MRENIGVGKAGVWAAYKTICAYIYVTPKELWNRVGFH